MNLGEKIFELRRAKNLSQENLADILGVTRQTVSKWETNQSLPDLDKVMPLCKVFGISVEELLGTGDSKSTEVAEPGNDDVDMTSNVTVSKSDDIKEKSRKRPKTRSEKIAHQINGIIWSASLLLYFLISFLIGGWHITWVLFIIAPLCCQIVKLVMSLSEENDKNKIEKSE